MHNFIVQNDMRSYGAPAQNGANSKKKYKKEICRILRQIFLFRLEKVAQKNFQNEKCRIYEAKKYIQNVWYLSAPLGKTGKKHKKIGTFCAKKFRAK